MLGGDGDVLGVVYNVYGEALECDMWSDPWRILFRQSYSLGGNAEVPVNQLERMADFPGLTPFRWTVTGSRTASGDQLAYEET